MHFFHLNLSYNDHEIQIENLAKRLGFSHISLSHKISSMIRAVPRGLTSKYQKLFSEKF
jgi:N-methylhydantoinase A/oxoprolinase/acetone carboxylase beta subunit